MTNDQPVPGAVYLAGDDMVIYWPARNPGGRFGDRPWLSLSPGGNSSWLVEVPPGARHVGYLVAPGG